MDIITGVASILVGGGLLAFIQFMISRHDNKNDRLKSIVESIEKLNEKVDELSAKGDERNAITARVRILRFADEMPERQYSKDSWDQVMADITDYEKYCAEHPDFKNSQTAITVEMLQQEYKDRLTNHNFLR